MKKNLNRGISMLLSVAMLISLLTVGAYAEGETTAPAEEDAAPAVVTNADTAKERGGTDISGMLALSQYVFVASEGEIADGIVTAEAYGVYAYGGEGDAAFVPVDYDGEIAVYDDSALTQKSAAVATVEDGILSVSGVATAGNVAYYLTTDAGDYTTIIYVVNSEVEDDAVLTMADGSTIDLTTYAPNMAYGDYTAEVGNDEINGMSSVYIGGNRTSRSLDDMKDTENYESNPDAAAWYLQSGITNSGTGLYEFGDTLYTNEWVVDIYRLFQIVVDEVTAVKGFSDPTDFVGSMGSNDPFSDAVSATIQGFVWNGLYTEYSDVQAPGGGFYLAKNIDGVTTMGVTQPVTGQIAYVTVFNSMTGIWSTLNTAGKVKAAELQAAAAYYDGAVKTAPDDYSNEAKIAAVAKVMGLPKLEDPTASLSKIEAVNVLYVASDYVASKTYPGLDRTLRTGSTNSNMEQLLALGDHITVNTLNLGMVQRTIDDENLITTDGTAIIMKAAGELTITNNTVSTHGTVEEANEIITKSSSPDTTLDGKEAVPIFASEAPGGTQDINDPNYLGLVYNATARNAYYRYGIGSALAIINKDSTVNLVSTDGTLVLDGETLASTSITDASTAAGIAFVGYGGLLNVYNGVVYSAGQHPTNILYNGSVHMTDACAIGTQRLFSSDFWGGYSIYEDSITSGWNVTDEPTTVIFKNSVHVNGRLDGNGTGSNYIENSLMELNYSVKFANKTSNRTDTAAATFVNSVVTMNSGTGIFAETEGSARGIVTVVDSVINIDGNILAHVDDYTGVNHVDTTGIAEEDVAAYQHLWDGQMEMDFYGTNSITTSDGTLTVQIDDGAELYVYSANLTEDDFTVVGGGKLTVVTDDAYGTVNVYGPEIAPEDTNVGTTAAVVVGGVAQEYTTGVVVDGINTGAVFTGSITSDSYFATGILVSGSVYAVKDATITLKTSPADNDKIPEGGTPVIGAGSGIAVRDGSTVTIEDCTITVDGAWGNMDYPSAGVVAGWQSQNTGDVVIMRNTTISNNGNDENTSNVGYFPGMPGVPFNIMKNLTVSGQGRAYVALGNAASYLYNDDIEGTGWAAICTDMATDEGLYVYSVGTKGVTTVGGYGVYSDTNCYDYFYASTLQGADFGVIISNNGLLVMKGADAADDDALMYATEEDIAAAADKQSTLIGGRNCIMTHATGDPTSESYVGTIDVADTVMTTDRAVYGGTEEMSYMEGFENFFQVCDGADILIKSSSEYVSLVNVDASSYTDTLILAVVDSDNGGISSTDYEGLCPANEVYLENVTTDGAMAINNYDFQRSMEVTVADMVYTGAVDYMTYDEFAAAGYLDGVNTVTSTADFGGLTMNIAEDASWVVSGTSYLTGLTIADGAVVTAPEGMTLVMTVDGVETPIAAGEYAGDIVITVKAPEVFKYVDDDGMGTWSWAAKYIYSVRDKGIMVGEAYKNGFMFNADDNLTRAQAAVIMLAVKGIAVDPTAECTFTDVDANAWYAPYVATAAANGLTAGNGDGTYAPDANISRAEFVTMLLAAKGIAVDPAAELTFPDVDANAWYAPYVATAAANSLTAGDENGNFNPEANIIRAEAATMVDAVS